MLDLQNVYTGPRIPLTSLSAPQLPKALRCGPSFGTKTTLRSTSGVSHPFHLSRPTQGPLAMSEDTRTPIAEGAWGIGLLATEARVSP